MKRYRLKVAVPLRSGATFVDEFPSLEASTPDKAKACAVEMAARDESARRYIDEDVRDDEDEIAAACRVLLRVDRGDYGPVQYTWSRFRDDRGPALEAAGWLPAIGRWERRVPFKPLWERAPAHEVTR